MRTAHGDSIWQYAYLLPRIFARAFQATQKWPVCLTKTVRLVHVLYVCVSVYIILYDSYILKYAVLIYIDLQK